MLERSLESRNCSLWSRLGFLSQAPRGGTRTVLTADASLFCHRRCSVSVGAVTTGGQASPGPAGSPGTPVGVSFPSREPHSSAPFLGWDGLCSRCLGGILGFRSTVLSASPGVCPAPSCCLGSHADWGLPLRGPHAGGGISLVSSALWAQPSSSSSGSCVTIRVS